MAAVYHRSKKTGLSEGVRVPHMRAGWRISTFGRITPAEVFERLFWTLFGSSVDRLPLLDRSVTYLFELCGKENKASTSRVVVVWSALTLLCRWSRSTILIGEKCGFVWSLF